MGIGKIYLNLARGNREYSARWIETKLGEGET
jgi:hypothetical protein